MDNFSKSSNNMFVARALNRAHNRHKNEGWIKERLNAPDSLFLPLWQTRVFVTGGEAPRPVLLHRGEMDREVLESAEAIFLGEDEGCGLFATEIGAAGAEPPAWLAGFGEFRDLRAAGPLLSRKDGALLAYAKAITYWHGRNHFCGSCGSPSRVGEGGHLRVCSNPECGALHFRGPTRL